MEGKLSCIIILGQESITGQESNQYNKGQYNNGAGV